MKDAYSFDIDEENAKKSYDNMYRTYLRIFRRLGLATIPFSADTGAIGGSMSHEFHVIAETGESQVFYDKRLEKLSSDDSFDIETMQSLYAMADDRHDPAKAPENIKSARGIEVGHIFYLGDKYSKAMKAEVSGTDGSQTTVKMGCYGIGISRLVGAIIEASHDSSGIIWPESVAPFKVGIINLKTGDEKCDKACEDLYGKLQETGIEALYDDRKESAGSKFATMDLIGLPWVVAVGPRGIAAGTVELKNRKTSEKSEISAEAALNKIL